MDAELEGVEEGVTLCCGVDFVHVKVAIGRKCARRIRELEVEF